MSSSFLTVCLVIPSCGRIDLIGRMLWPGEAACPVSEGGSRARPKSRSEREDCDVQERVCGGGKLILHRVFLPPHQVCYLGADFGCAGVADFAGVVQNLPM